MDRQIKGDRKRRKTVLGAVLTTLGGVCWGASGSMGQYLFTREGMDARWLVPIRLSLAGIILFFWCLAKHRRKLFGIWQKKRDAIFLLIYGILGVSLCQFAYFRTIQLSSAGVGTILQDLSPAMILIVSCIAAKRLPRANEVLCLILAFGGVTLIVTHGDFADMAVSTAALAMGILSAVCVTVYNLMTGPLAARYPVVVMQAWSFLMGGGIFALVFRPWEYHYAPSAVGIFGIIFVVVVGNVMAFTFYITGVSYIGPSRGILYGFSEPVTAAIIGTAFLGNEFTLWDAVGFASVFAMLALISADGRKQIQSGEENLVNQRTVPPD